MASYIEGALTKDEVIQYEGRISLWSLTHLIVLGVLLIPLYGIGLILLIMAFVRYKTTELAFTNKRVIAKFGFISRQTIEAMPSIGGNIQDYMRLDPRLVQIDKAARRVSLSIKSLEMAEEKEAIEQFGSSDSGASLGDILGAALREKAGKD